MGFWPFGRKNRRSSRIEDKPATATAKEIMPGSSSTDVHRPQIPGHGTMASSRSPTPNESKRQKRVLSKGVGPPSRAQTAPHSRNIEPQSSDPEKALIGGPRSLASRATNRDPSDVPSYYYQNPTSHSSLGPENFTAVSRPPTLRAKRSSIDQNFNRRKSSKRKAEDHAREQEIRALSSPVPTRLSTRTGDPLRRDTKKVPGGLNKHFERPSSNISLPLVESLHESMSENSDHHTFTVNPFSALTPRPTLRYSDMLRPGPLRSINQSRASNPREKRPMIPEEDMQSKKCIDELADNLNASGLRELMERDQRRREKKRQQDQESLQRKLERKAERQREERRKKTEKVQGREPVATANIDRGVQGREAVGLGVENVPIGVEIPKPPENPFADDRAKSPGSWLEDPSKEHLPETTADDPFKDDVSEPFALQGTKSDRMENEVDERLSYPERESRPSQASLSPATSPVRTGPGLASTSQLSGLGKELTLDIPEHEESDRRDSDTSGRVNNWTSFFKRGGTRHKRASADRGVVATQSDFSNTSRESFSRQVPPPPIPPRSFRRSGSTPVRTMSKFREDLPEFPISPPDSRIQSPDTAVTSSSPHPDRSSYGFGRRDEESSATPRELSDLAKENAHRSLDTNPSEPRSAVVSQSLASVDSEGSWLSGKPVKRASMPSPSTLRESGIVLPLNVQDIGDSGDVGDVTEDEYFTRLTPGFDDRRESTSAERKASSTAMGAQSDDDDNESIPPLPRGDSPEDEAIHQSVERFPTVIHAKPSAKSREGLLQEFQSSESEAETPDIGMTPDGETPGSAGGSGEDRWIHRATSVDYGKGHARHISAGSAKLLDVPRRGSLDVKRLSSASGEKASVNPSEAAVTEEQS